MSNSDLYRFMERLGKIKHTNVIQWPQKERNTYLSLILIRKGLNYKEVRIQYI